MRLQSVAVGALAIAVGLGCLHPVTAQQPDPVSDDLTRWNRVYELTIITEDRKRTSELAELRRTFESLASESTETELDFLSEFTLWWSSLRIRPDHEEASEASLKRLLDSPPEFQAAETIASYAGDALKYGAVELAEQAAGSALRHDVVSGSNGARLWLVRAAACRMQGKWDEARWCVDAAESALGSDQARESEQSEPVDTLTLDGRVRIHLERLHIDSDLGLLDRAWSHMERARALPLSELGPNTRATAYLAEIDLATMTNGYEIAGQVARDAKQDFADEEGVSSYVLHSLTFAEGLSAGVTELMASLGVHRFEPRPELSESSSRTVLLGLLEEPDLSPVLAFRSQVHLAHGALWRGELEAAAEHLQRAREQRDALGSALDFSAERGLLAALTWRHARAAGASASDLAQHREALLGEYRAVLDQWRAMDTRAGGVGFLHLSWRTAPLITLIEATLDAYGPDAGPARALELVLEAQAIGSHARRLGLTVPSIAEIQASLAPPSVALLQLVPGDERSYLFAMEGDTVTCEPVPAFDQLRMLVGPVRNDLRRGATPNADQVEALSEAILPKELRERADDWTGIYAVGFQVLGDVPIEVLRTAKGPSIGQGCAVAMLPSIVLGVSLADLPGPPPETERDLALLVATDPGPGEPEFVALPFGEDEREQLVSAFDEDRVVVRTGREEIEALLASKRSELADASTVHLMAHGWFDPTRERGAVLVLGGTPRRFLDSADVEDLELSGLVILSACSAARGPSRTGDDSLAHLGDAFLRAGARCVVLAERKVDFVSTVDLFERVHTHLAAGLAPARALHAARRELGAEATDAGTWVRTPYRVLGIGL